MLNFRSENLKNKARKSLMASPYFFVLAIVFSITLGLLAVDSFRLYKSDISALIVLKNESASSQAEQIMENLTDITHRLSFYDRILFDDQEIRDPFAGLSKDERKELWNKSFAIERLPNSTTINISIFNKDKAEGNKIARQAALSLSEVASHFYNIKTELEFRVIEGPISSSFIRSWHWLIGASVLGGLILAYLVLFLLKVLPGRGQQETSRELLRKDFFAPSGEEVSLHLEEADFPVSVERKAAAPVNLPIAEEEIPNVAHRPTSEILSSIPTEDEGVKGEPTDEEYRERLNKLLRGEI